VVLIGERAVAGDHEQPADTAERCNNLLDRAVGEILLLVIAGQVLASSRSIRRLYPATSAARITAGRRSTRAAPKVPSLAAARPKPSRRLAYAITLCASAEGGSSELDTSGREGENGET